MTLDSESCQWLTLPGAWAWSDDDGGGSAPTGQLQQDFVSSSSSQTAKRGEQAQEQVLATEGNTGLQLGLFPLAVL